MGQRRADEWRRVLAFAVAFYLSWTHDLYNEADAWRHAAENSSFYLVRRMSRAKRERLGAEAAGAAVL